jgi:hypothetical protein
MAKILNSKDYETVKLYDNDGVAISAANPLHVAVDDLSVTISGGSFSSDIDHVAGENVGANKGNATAGTLRVCIATDDIPLALTNNSIGATDDALVDAGAVGSLSAKTRRVTTDLAALLTTNGATDDALVDAGATGSLSAKLRRLTTDQAALMTVNGAISDAVVDGGAIGSVSAKLRRLTTDLAAIKLKTDNIPAQGQALAAASLPVILPAATINTLTPPAAITNFANETGGNLAEIKTNTDNIPAPGQALAAASLPIVLPALQAADLKSVILTDNPLTVDKKLRVSSVPYGYDVAEGQISGHSTLFKTGYQATVNNVEVDLWPVLGSYVFPTTEMQMEFTSSSANDTTDGTGARTVKIWYLTSGFVEKTETITLSGTGVAQTTATDIYRVNAFRVMTAGTLGCAAGNIDLRHLSNTPIYSRILAGNTRARNSIYTVPVGKTLYITQITYSVGHASGGRYARFTLRAKYDDFAAALALIFYPYHEIGLQDNAISINMDFPIKFPAGTDIKISVISDASNADAICTGAYRGWLET